MYTTVRFEEDELEEPVINSIACIMQGLLPTGVFLDNQPNINIVHPMLLINMRKAKQKIKVKGVGRTQLIVDMEGNLKYFSEV
jgi:hypothetical protein